MEATIKVQLEISLSEATKAFFTGLIQGATKTAPKSETPAAPAAPAKPAKPAAPAKPAEPAKPAAPAKPAEPAKPAAPAKPAEPADVIPEVTVTVEDIRPVLMAKVNAHRKEIKEKLTELGASSVTTLAPENLPEMLNFLNSLS